MEIKKAISVILIFIIVGLLIFFMPDIYKYLNNINNPKVIDVYKEEAEEKIEEITLNSDIIKNIKYPIMRYDLYSDISYYQSQKFKVSDLTNNEILVNAFVDVYEGNISTYNGDTSGCTDSKKELKAIYLDSRIRNILSNSIKYEYTDFAVSELYNYSSYIGEWKYSSLSNSYIYHGNCNINDKNIKYYDLKYLDSVESNNNNNIIILYAYIGFAKIDGEKYYIYSDPNYTNLVLEGFFIDYNDLDNMFKVMNKGSFNKYKYIFEKGLCTYGDYCLSESEWLDE